MNMTSSISFKKFLAIGFPIFLYNIIGFLFVFIDSLMIAPLGEEYLGAIGQAGIFFTVTVIFFQGILSMFIPLVSKLDIEKSSFEFRNYFFSTLLIAVIMAVPIIILNSLADEILTLFNQPKEIVVLAEAYISVLKWSAIWAMIYTCFIHLLNLTDNSKYIVWTVIISNVVNVFFNWVFIYGNLGFPELGIEGSALATNFARISVIVFLIAISNKILPFKLFASKIKIRMEFIKILLSKGVPKGISYVNEWFSSFILVLFVGFGGVLSISSNQIGDNISSLIYMVPQAIATVFVIVLSKIINDGYNIFNITLKKLVFYGMILNFSVVILTYFSLPYLISLFSVEVGTDVFELAKKILIVHLIFFPFYCLQYMFLSVLDSMLDTKWPSVISLITTYTFIIPISFFIAYYTKNPVYIWIIDGVGNIILSVVFYLRYKNKFQNKYTLTGDKHEHVLE